MCNPKYIDFRKPISDNSKQSVSLDVKTMLLCNIWLAALQQQQYTGELLAQGKKESCC